MTSFKHIIYLYVLHSPSSCNSTVADGVFEFSWAVRHVVVTSIAHFWYVPSIGAKLVGRHCFPFLLQALSSIIYNCKYILKMLS